MTEVYIRKFYDQELGFRGGLSGKAGRYIFVSKNCLSFFPPLSDTIQNDKLFLRVIPSFNNNIVYAVYVYHNDSLFGGSRNEYRLYLNKELDPEGDYYKKNDIIVLQKFLKYDGTIFYKIHHYPVSQKSLEYGYLDAILHNSPIKGNNHALVDIKKVPFIPNINAEPSKTIIPNDVKEEALESKVNNIEKTKREKINLDDIPKYEDLSTRLIRSTSFRDLVLFFYNNQCAISKTSISYKDLINLEAAHIQPDSHYGPLHPSNGIALNRDLHWAFDKGFFTISKDYKVKVHPDVINEPLLQKINDSEIVLPEDKRARPNIKFIEYHNDVIYGLFLTSGVIRLPDN